MLQFFGKFIPRTLFARIGLTFFVLVFALSAAQYVVFYFYSKNYLDETAQRLNWNLANNLAVRLNPLLERGTPSAELEIAIDEAERLNPEIEVFVLDETGAVLVPKMPKHKSVKKGEPRQYPPVPLRQIEEFLQLDLSRDLPLYGNNPADRNKPSVFSVAKIVIGGQPGYLYVVLRSSRFHSASAGTGDIYLIMGALIMHSIVSVVTIVIGGLLFFFITRRFKVLSAVVRTFSQGSLDERVNGWWRSLWSSSARRSLW